MFAPSVIVLFSTFLLSGLSLGIVLQVSLYTKFLDSLQQCALAGTLVH